MINDIKGHAARQFRMANAMLFRFFHKKDKDTVAVAKTSDS